MSSSTISTSVKKTEKNNDHTFRNEVALKFFSGYAGGIVQSAVSHPFDLVKSRVQANSTGTTKTGVFQVLLHVFRNEGGLFALYKGVGPPTVVAGFTWAILFSTNEFWRRQILKHSPERFLLSATHHHRQDNASPPPPTWVIALSGVLSSPCLAAVQAPNENVKTRLQLQKHTVGAGRAGGAAAAVVAGREYSGMIDCVIKMVRHEGLSSLWVGFWPGLLTRTLGLPFYFLGAHFGNTFLQSVVVTTIPPSSSSSSSSSSSLSPSSSPPSATIFFGIARQIVADPAFSAGFGGVCAGLTYWTSVLWSDTIRVRTMTSRGAKRPRQIARELYMQGGWRAFYAGYRASVVRSIPANSSVFASMNLFERWWKKKT